MNDRVIRDSLQVLRALSNGNLQRKICCSFLNILKNNFIYLFLAMLGLNCWAGFSLVSESGSSSLIVVCGLLITVASPLVEHRPQGVWAQ